MPPLAALHARLHAPRRTRGGAGPTDPSKQHKNQPQNVSLLTFYLLIRGSREPPGVSGDPGAAVAAPVRGWPGTALGRAPSGAARIEGQVAGPERSEIANPRAKETRRTCRSMRGGTSTIARALLEFRCPGSCPPGRGLSSRRSWRPSTAAGRSPERAGRLRRARGGRVRRRRRGRRRPARRVNRGRGRRREDRHGELRRRLRRRGRHRVGRAPPVRLPVGGRLDGSGAAGLPHVHDGLRRDGERHGARRRARARAGDRPRASHGRRPRLPRRRLCVRRRLLRRVLLVPSVHPSADDRGHANGGTRYVAGGASLPRGRYRAEWVDGCMRWSPGGPAFGWDVNDPPPGVFAGPVTSPPVRRRLPPRRRERRVRRGAARPHRQRGRLGDERLRVVRRSGPEHPAHRVRLRRRQARRPRERPRAVRQHDGRERRGRQPHVANHVRVLPLKSA